MDSPVKAITLPHACTTCSVTRCGVSKPADAFCTVHLRGNNDIKAIGEPIYFSRQGRLHCHPLFSAQLTAESPGLVSISGRCQSCRQETVMSWTKAIVRLWLTPNQHQGADLRINRTMSSLRDRMKMSPIHPQMVNTDTIHLSAWRCFCLSFFVWMMK